jgi:CRP-like cAMP-binding protein
VSFVGSLKTLPLFQGIPDARLEQLLSAFRSIHHKAGTQLFVPLDLATHFELLVQGEVCLEESATTKYELQAFAPLGELGALTGIPRSTTATATTDIELLSIPVADLMGFFDANADIGLAFYKNLLAMVSEKVRRDRRRLFEMRGNIIRTQKVMKQMRETVLAAQETATSKPLFEALEQLIGNNRRAKYRACPTAGYPAYVKIDEERTARVLEVSEGYIKLQGAAKDFTNDPSYWAGVLVLPAGEILVSGTIVREGDGGVVVKLDTLVEEFQAKLDAYNVRLQLLDYIV